MSREWYREKKEGWLHTQNTLLALLTVANFDEIVETVVITFSTISSAVMPECATRAMLQR